MYCVTKLQLKLLTMIYAQSINPAGYMVYTYTHAQRKVMNSVLDMLNPVVVEGAMYPAPTQDDADVAIAFLKEAGINI
jgi:hypothetical protein